MKNKVQLRKPIKPAGPVFPLSPVRQILALRQWMYSLAPSRKEADRKRLGAMSKPALLRILAREQQG